MSEAGLPTNYNGDNPSAKDPTAFRVADTRIARTACFCWRGYLYRFVESQLFSGKDCERD